MKISCDPAKNDWNILHRGLNFYQADRFDFANSIIGVDHRKNYSETRYQAVGNFNNRLHVLVFAETADGIRVISFRKANSREDKRYEKATQS